MGCPRGKGSAAIAAILSAYVSSSHPTSGLRCHASPSSSRAGGIFPRVSPRGDRIAFIQEGRIHVVDSSGKESFVSRKFLGVPSFAWGPKGDEIWVTEPFVAPGVVYAVGLSGKERILLRIP